MESFDLLAVYRDATGGLVESVIVEYVTCSFVCGKEINMYCNLMKNINVKFESWPKGGA